MEGGRWIPAGCFGGLGSLKVLDLGFFFCLRGSLCVGLKKLLSFRLM